jgi:hypothetical protein
MNALVILRYGELSKKNTKDTKRSQNTFFSLPNFFNRFFVLFVSFVDYAF